MTSSETAPATWSDIANWYDRLLTSGSGPHDTALNCLADLLLPVEGLEVVDVACGQGIATRLTASLGASVVGADSSPTMIANARRHGTPEGSEIRYVVADAQTLSPFDSGSFDAATCQLALMDIPDLDAALMAIARVLRPQGWFAFVIGHPCFLVPHAQRVTIDEDRPAVTVTGYFNERFWRSSNPNGVRRAGNHHRMLSTYLNALTRAGFDVEECQEPQASDLLARQQPLYTEVPIFFGARAQLRRDTR
ncbi:MAG: class I SAM-dependent methyltransferase [Actinomycetia bacterium]|nr:class I SAM-dependent methyltransferase [Actinomycetes bacterium]